MMQYSQQSWTKINNCLSLQLRGPRHTPPSMHIKESATRIASVCVLSDSRLFREATSSWLVRLRRFQWVAAAGSMASCSAVGRPRRPTSCWLMLGLNGALGTELLYGIAHASSPTPD